MQNLNVCSTIGSGIDSEMQEPIYDSDIQESCLLLTLGEIQVDESCD